MRERTTPITIATQPTINATSRGPISHRLYVFSSAFVLEYDKCRHRRHNSRPNKRRPPPRTDGIYRRSHDVRRCDPKDQRAVEAFLITEFRLRRTDRREAGDRGHIEGNERDQRGNRDTGGEHPEEKVHLAMNLIQSYAHESIYDKHDYIDYSAMKDAVIKSLVLLFQ